MEMYTEKQGGRSHETTETTCKQETWETAEKQRTDRNREKKVTVATTVLLSLALVSRTAF